MKKKSEAKKKIINDWNYSRIVRPVAAALLSFGGVCAMPWMVSMEKIGYTNSIFTVFLFAALFWLMEKALPAGNSSEECADEYSAKFSGRASGSLFRWLFPGIFGVFFSVCMVFGNRLDGEGYVPFQNAGMWLALLVLAILFTVLVRYFWDSMAGAGRGRNRSYLAKCGSRSAGGNCNGRAEKGNEKKRKGAFTGLFIRAGVIFACYLPVFLAVYPGFFVYDAQEEYLQVVTRNFSTHHPLVHVLLLGGMIQLIYKLTGSYNFGIACYTLLQMTVMSVIFSWCVEKMKSRGLRKAGRVLGTLYFGLCPVLVMFSLCSAKDGLFTGALLVVVMLLQELCMQPSVFFQRKGNVFLLIAASVFMMLFRHNGFYAFLVYALTGTIYFWANGRKEAGREEVFDSDEEERGQKADKGREKRLKAELLWVKPVICFTASAMVYLLISKALVGVFHADASENQEILTVPISQMARVYRDEKESLSAGEKETLYRYLPEEALLRYTPKVSDGVKISFNNVAYKEDPAGFWKLWAKWGIAHPFTYCNAWFMTSYGFWYPDTVIDVYRGNTVFTFTYKDSSYFGYEVEQPGVRESKIPWLDELYRKMSLEVFQQKIPVVSMLFSPGFLFWAAVFLLGFLCYQGCWKRVMPFILPLLYWLTLLLGPTYLVRYVVFLWALLPLLLGEAIEEISLGTV